MGKSARYDSSLWPSLPGRYEPPNPTIRFEQSQFSEHSSIG